MFFTDMDMKFKFGTCGLDGRPNWIPPQFLEDSTRGEPYPCRKFYVDLACVNAIKSLDYTKKTLLGCNEDIFQ